MADDVSSDQDRVRTAEIIAALSLATDLALGAPFEYGLRSTLAAMNLCDRFDVDSETASQTFFLCLLFYVGCNAPVDVGAEFFGDDESFVMHATPARFGSRTDMAKGMMRAIAPPDGSPPQFEVVRLLARGQQTKQIARALDISVKTADYHIQNAYRKMGVSTRAGATLFAMQHGFVTWDNSR